MAENEIDTDRTAYALARLAECGDPDHEDSPGAEFLGQTVDALAEAVRWDAENDGGRDLSDIIAETADGAVPIGTYELWRVFVDLTAYTEDTSELVSAGAHLTDQARVALYLVAERLCYGVTGDLDRIAT